jgi:hypothetical protein
MALFSRYLWCAVLIVVVITVEIAVRANILHPRHTTAPILRTVVDSSLIVLLIESGVSNLVEIIHF